MKVVSRSEFAQTLYERLTNEEDARVCRDISEEACRATPGNFVLILASQCLTKLGDAVTNPKTVLAWVATSVGAPSAVLGLLVPIRESGSLIPQLVVGGLVRRLARRKWVWVAGSLLQGLAVVGMAAAASSLTGWAAGAGLLVSLTLFSLARGLCSVASKDVIGKTVPKGRRGQLTGWSASVAGVISLAIGGVFLLSALDGANVEQLAVVLLLGAATWLVAAGVYGMVREEPGETDGGGNALKESLGNLRLIATDRAFRTFVIARSLLMCSALSAPYYVALAQQHSDAGGRLLGAFIVAGGSAGLLSGPVWGRFADLSSRRVMLTAAILTSATGILVALLGFREVPGLGSIWLMPGAYFLLSIAHSGVRVGRKTYVVDLASGNRRTDYVSVSNSIIGVLLLLVGLSGLLAGQIGASGMIGLLSIMGAMGALVASKLPEV
ncbi:MAG: MFS transporter [Pseudomonadales bacterium]